MSKFAPALVPLIAIVSPALGEIVDIENPIT